MSVQTIEPAAYSGIATRVPRHPLLLVYSTDLTRTFTEASR